MSILNVEHLSHGFGDRAIFSDVSFRLLKGEHIGLIGANGEGKSTFMSIITDKLMPDEGKVEWAKNVRVGYLDQHTVLEAGKMCIRDRCKVPADKFKLQEDEMTWAAEHVVGVAQGVSEDIIADLRANFEGECSEVGMYLAMARVAHREGYPEIGLYYEKDVYKRQDCIIVCEGAGASLTIRKLAEQHGCTVIATAYDTYTAARLINQSMPVSYFMTTEDVYKRQDGCSKGDK